MLRARARHATAARAGSRRSRATSSSACRGTQVWIVDRREQAFEDTSVFERTRDPQVAQDYYLGFKYERVTAADARFVSEWGLKTQLNDLRRVVRAARKGGREVILGGHSAGASTAVAYAAWDFGGRAGYRDLAGLVLIDGGLLGSFDSADLARAKSELAQLRRGEDLFLDLLGLGIPEIAGIFTQVGALWAYERPDEASALQRYPLLPATFKPPFTVTNEAQLGYVFDETTASDALALIQLRAGQLARERRPAALAGRRADADPPLRPGLVGERAERDRVVLPAPAAARHRRRQRAAPERRRAGTSACGCRTAARSTCRCTPTAPSSRTAAWPAARAGWRSARASASRWSWTTATPTTSTRSPPRRSATAS